LDENVVENGLIMHMVSCDTTATTEKAYTQC